MLPHPGDALDSTSITEFVCEKDKHLVSLNNAWQAGIFKNNNAVSSSSSTLSTFAHDRVMVNQKKILDNIGIAR